MKDVLLYGLVFVVYFAIYHFISFEIAVMFALADIATSMHKRFKDLKQK